MSITKLNNSRLVAIPTLAVILALLAACGGHDTEQEQNRNSFVFGDDLFVSGLEVEPSGDNVENLYLAGEHLVSDIAINDSAYAAGRSINLRGDIGDNVHAAGMDVVVTSAVQGDAKLTGYNVWLAGDLGGDLIAAGYRITVDAPVAGYALLSGKRVNINNVIAGDLSLTAGQVNFGPEARVGGKLLIYERDEGSVQVPEFVADASQIERRKLADYRRGHDLLNFAGAALALAAWIVVVALLAASLAAFAPSYAATLRERSRGAPFKTLGLGCVGLSLAFGSVLVLALSIIGAVLIPVVVVLTLLGLLLAYILGAYLLGEWARVLIKKPQAEKFLQHLLTAAIGATLISALGFVPLLGWLLVFALVLLGVGVLTAKVIGYFAAKRAVVDS